MILAFLLAIKLMGCRGVWGELKGLYYQFRYLFFQVKTLIILADEIIKRPPDMCLTAFSNYLTISSRGIYYSTEYHILLNFTFFNDNVFSIKECIP